MPVSVARLNCLIIAGNSCCACFDEDYVFKMKRIRIGSWFVFENWLTRVGRWAKGSDSMRVTGFGKA